MTRSPGLLALVLAGAAATSSCAANDQSLQMVSFVVLDRMQNCMPTSTSMLTQNLGVVDAAIVRILALSQGYVAVPLLQNNLFATGNTTPIERNILTVNTFEVELVAPRGQTLPDLGGLPLRYSVSSAVGNLTPGGGRQVAAVELLPGDLVLALAASRAQPGNNWNGTVVAHTRAVGSRGPDFVYSNYLDLPITVCTNCLSDPDAPCPQDGFKPMEVNLGGCRPQQDVPITCCRRGNTPFCGSLVPMSQT